MELGVDVINRNTCDDGSPRRKVRLDCVFEYSADYFEGGPGGHVDKPLPLH